jgi:hypothetical protein
MTTLLHGALVTVAGKGPVLDGIVFETPSTLKVVVAVPDQARGAVLRTVHPDTLTERTDPGAHDEALRRLIRRTTTTGRGGARSGTGPGQGPRGFTRTPAHRPTGK